MPDFVRLHQEDGREILLNREHILYAEADGRGKGCSALVTNGQRVFLQEDLTVLRNKPH